MSLSDTDGFPTHGYAHCLVAGAMHNQRFARLELVGHPQFSGHSGILDREGGCTGQDKTA